MYRVHPPRTEEAEDKESQRALRGNELHRRGNWHNAFDRFSYCNRGVIPNLRSIRAATATIRPVLLLRRLIDKLILLPDMN